MIARRIRAVLWFILFTAVTGIAGLVGKEISKDYIRDNHRKDVLEALRKKSAEMNSGFPQILDKETRIDTTTVDSDPPSITYHYTLINHDSTDISWKDFNASMFTKTKTTYCNTMKPLLKEWVHAAYSYKGNDDILIGTINLSPVDCMDTKGK